ncbi:MAG: hypothetical protein ACFFCQ_06535 [Promethearchaeota archaeon]
MFIKKREEYKTLNKRIILSFMATNMSQELEFTVAEALSRGLVGCPECLSIVSADLDQCPLCKIPLRVSLRIPRKK